MATSSLALLGIPGENRGSTTYDKGYVIYKSKDVFLRIESS
jgi:hypothetical protein